MCGTDTPPPPSVKEPPPEGKQLKVQLRVAGFGISLVTRSPRVGPHELIYIKLQTIALECVPHCHSFMR